MLASICDVLLAALHCEAGELLSDEAVCAAVQAAYHIGHQSGREGPLLTGVSRRTLLQVVYHLFGRAGALQSGAGSSDSHTSRLSLQSASVPPLSPRAAGAPSFGHGVGACCEVFAFAASLAAYAETEEEGPPRGRGRHEPPHGTS